MGWQQTFADEFNGSSLDTAVWKYADYWGLETSISAGDCQCYKPNNISFGDGALTIQARKEFPPGCNPDPGTLEYTSGEISTGFTFSQQYGYFEIRAWMPEGKGIFPQFELQVPGGAFPPRPPEIVIAEMYGQDPDTVQQGYSTVDGFGNVFNYEHEFAGPDFSEGFHTYGIDWQPGSLTWYVDGRETLRYIGSDVPMSALYPIIKMAVGSNEVGSPDASTVFPADLKIDYFRAYQRIDDGAPDALPPGAVADPGSAPVVQAANFAGQVNVLISGAVAGTDADLDNLTYKVIGSAPAGLDFNPDGTFTYQGAQTGNVTFQYRANDGFYGSNTATVTIEVSAAVNAAPAAATDSFGTGAAKIYEGSEFLIDVTDLLANDSDPDGDAFMFDGIVTGAGKGTASVVTEGGSTYVAYTYTGAPLAENGITDDSFTYRVMDAEGAVGMGTVNLTVTALANTTITGGNGSETLDGSNTAHDTMDGRNGDDVLNGLAGNDKLFGNNGSDHLYGGAGNDTCDGGSGNDTLDGGTGNDAMAGGANNDTYVVDSSGDTVTEATNGGTDLILTALSAYTLGTNVENLTFTGTGPFQGTGNSQSNAVTGGSDGDTIDGGTGIDRLVGLGGDDTYLVDNALDVVEEAANGGIDTVFTTGALHVLAANVENLTYSGTGRFMGTGNAAANTITGGGNADTVFGLGGNDVMGGLAGNDTLSGGAGDDTFLATVSDGNDRYDGGAGNDTYSLIGTTAAATVSLLAGTSTSSQTGSDTLIQIENVIGGSGADRIVAGSGLNVLTGGAGNDTFAFMTEASAGSGANRDQVLDFASGDRIDVSGIDASNALAGNNAFSFIGQIATVANGVGQLARGQIGFRYVTDASGNVHTLIEGNVNANAGADSTLR